MAKRGLTTETVHSDRRSGVEHGALRKPIHTSTQYGFERTDDLIGVFQGRIKGGFNYARQGTPTTAALEAVALPPCSPPSPSSQAWTLC